ncbi:Wall-associated receptor kinase-like [Thalictrum thalictroides]|uniref:Wall-associated receptor kinase-like n=1 Tax=Thalictrum thalictroides TaxID=46969 RepID=A0A7J6W7Z2_THATH|nr:Wall-associated receptor kinase-like [Thalictrum thalictroides]
MAVEFQRIQLGWWLKGNCKCSDHTTCTNFTVNGELGFRCRCNRGYVGDGFSAGVGCRKASSKCNPSKYMSGHCGGTTRVGGALIGGIIAGAIFMTGLALLCYIIQKKTSFLKSRKSARHMLAEAAGSCSIPFYSYKEIERATSCFSERHRIGTGAYGTVYAGKLHNDEWVAIKKIRHREADGIEQVMNEIKLLSSVSHPNLVRLIGCRTERDEQILVYEFMPNGTLSQHLQKERETGLPWTIRLSIATETDKSDVYSFGVVLVEIISALKMVDFSRHHSEVNLL